MKFAYEYPFELVSETRPWCLDCCQHTNLYARSTINRCMTKYQHFPRRPEAEITRLASGSTSSRLTRFIQETIANSLGYGWWLVLISVLEKEKRVLASQPHHHAFRSKVHVQRKAMYVYKSMERCLIFASQSWSHADFMIACSHLSLLVSLKVLNLIAQYLVNLQSSWYTKVFGMRLNTWKH